MPIFVPIAGGNSNCKQHRNVNKLGDIAAPMHALWLKKLSQMANFFENTSEAIEKFQVGQDVFCELLEVAIHQILYLRNLYPHGVFEKKKKYHVPVQVCLHPDVASYIANVIDSLRILVRSCTVNRVAVVVISDATNKPLEKFLFDVDFNCPPRSNEDDTYLLQLEQAIREFILKLNVCDALLHPLPQDCTWTVQVETKESHIAAIYDQQLVKGFPWVAADPQQTTINSAQLIPLKATQSGFMQMQMYIEESHSKK